MANANGESPPAAGRLAAGNAATVVGSDEAFY
jgi:hypothetical protein